MLLTNVRMYQQLFKDYPDAVDFEQYRKMLGLGRNRAQKWINTYLPIKGNSRRAKQMMNQAIREWEPILESNTERLNAQQSLAIHSESNSSDEHKTAS